jgi:flagellar M-ring protein FliF
MMPDRLVQVWEGLIAFLMAQPPARRATLAAVGIGSMAMVLGVAWWAQQPLYRPLFTNLSPDDAGAIVEALKAEKVSYQLDDGGRAVLVPAERLYELRLTLASRGLPEGGGVGFEVFDKQTLGQTDFQQRLNFQRALQGELSRTIGQLAGVDAARVHLAIPERSLFVSQNRGPSASVVVKLAQGRTLARAQVDGIVHLVASSVEGLDAGHVTVVDESGRVLTSDKGSQTQEGLSSSALEYQQGYETTLEERVQSMLGAVVGRDKVIARVTATMDFARVERTEESYDPDKSVLKQTHTVKEISSGAKPGAAPGTATNLTNDANAAVAEGPKSERKDESSSYEISKVISRTVGPVGTLKSISVAVMVDGTYTGEGEKKAFTPRPQPELDRMRDLVKRAVGADDKRGDKVEVVSVAFVSDPPMETEGTLGTVGRWAPVVGTRLLGVLFALVMFFRVIRPLLVSLGATPGGIGGGTIPNTPEAAIAALTNENLGLLQERPDRAAQLVREWLIEGSPGGRPE